MLERNWFNEHVENILRKHNDIKTPFKLNKHPREMSVKGILPTNLTTVGS